MPLNKDIARFKNECRKTGSSGVYHLVMVAYTMDGGAYSLRGYYRTKSKAERDVKRLRRQHNISKAKVVTVRVYAQKRR